MENQIEENDEGFIDYLNISILQKKLSQTSWLTVYNHQDPNIATEVFLDELYCTIWGSTEKRRRGRKYMKISPWMTNEVLQSIKIKRQLYKKTKKNVDDTQLQMEYKQHRNKLTSLIRTTKQEYNATNEQPVNECQNEIWDILKKLNGYRKSQENIDVCEDYKDQVIGDMKLVATEIDKVLGTIRKTISEKLEETIEYIPPIQTVSRSSILFLVDSKEVKSIIQDLTNERNEGDDNFIILDAIKSIASHILEPLKYLLNLCFETGIWPSAFRKSLTVPIHKNGDPTSFTNHRLISLRTQISKIFKKVLKNRLLVYAEKFKLISDCQLGFREGETAEYFLLTLMSKIIPEFKNSEPSLCVFMDLNEAVSAINYDSLIDSMKDLGIREESLHIFEDYLTNTRQYVDFGDKREAENIEYMISQDKVLGPILLQIFLRKMFFLEGERIIVGFNDKIAIFYVAKTWEELKEKTQNDLSRIKKFTDHKLPGINLKEANYIPFHCDRGLPLFENLCVDESFFSTQKNEIKFLDVIIDSHLIERWVNHIQNTPKVPT